VAPLLVAGAVVCRESSSCTDADAGAGQAHAKSAPWAPRRRGTQSRTSRGVPVILRSEPPTTVGDPCHDHLCRTLVGVASVKAQSGAGPQVGAYHNAAAAKRRHRGARGDAPAGLLDAGAGAGRAASRRDPETERKRCGQRTSRWCCVWLSRCWHSGRTRARTGPRKICGTTSRRILMVAPPGAFKKPAEEDGVGGCQAHASSGLAPCVRVL